MSEQGPLKGISRREFLRLVIGGLLPIWNNPLSIFRMFELSQERELLNLVEQNKETLLSLERELMSSLPTSTKVVFHGEKKPGKPWVSITVDDGYGYIERFHKVCKEYNVKITAFPTGGSLRVYRDQWRSFLESGLVEVGCHTYGHENLVRLLQSRGKKGVKEEIENWWREVTNVLSEVLPEKEREEWINAVNSFVNLPDGLPSSLSLSLYNRLETYNNQYIAPFIRPPFGAGYGNPVLLEIFWEGGFYFTVMWNVDSESTTHAINDPSSAFLNVVDGLHNGAIILLHFNRTDSSIFPRVVERVLKNGYEIVPLSQMFASKIGEINSIIEALRNITDLEKRLSKLEERLLKSSVTIR